MSEPNNNSWDTLIEFTRAQIDLDNLDWLPVPEFKSGTRTALLANITGQYMRDLERKEEQTGEPQPPDFTAFKKVFKTYYNKAKTGILTDLGAYHTRSLESTAKEPEHLLAIRPTEHALTVDKISNNAFINVFTNNVKQALAMERKGSSIQVTTYVTVNYDGLDRAKVHGVKWLTLFDREVLDAVHTLFLAGNRFMTIDQINRVMSGKSKDARTTAKQAERINNSLTKLMYTQIIIDATEEASFFGYEKFVCDKSVIVGERGEATVNGLNVKGLYVYDLALLGYAENKNQIARVPLMIKNTPINKTDTTIVLQGYLLRRVNQIKSGLGNVISLDNLLSDLDIIDVSKGKLSSKEANKRKTTVDQIKTILDYWSAPDVAFIGGYEVIGKRPVTGFKVYPRVNVLPESN